MNPEKQTQVRERLNRDVKYLIGEGYSKTEATKTVSRELRGELLDEGLTSKVVNELIKNAQRR